MAAQFAPTRLDRLISYVIHSFGRELGGIELAKILYLIDVETVSFLGEPFSGEQYVRAQRGPLARNFRASIRRMDGYEIEVRKASSRGRSEWGKNCHRPGPDPRFSPDLSPVDKAISDRVLERVQPLSPLQLEELAYATEPMRAIVSKEREVGTLMIGAPLDLSLVHRNDQFRRWKVNTSDAPRREPEYEAFLERERAEVAELLASLE